jgi:serine/threonine protein kinase
MAPEVIRQESYGKPADIWSLGCTVLQMVTGSPPWKSMKFENVNALLYYVATQNKIPPLPDKISDSLRSFLTTCFQRQPTERSAVMDLLDHPFIQSYDELNDSMRSLSSRTDMGSLLSLDALTLKVTPVADATTSSKGHAVMPSSPIANNNSYSKVDKATHSSTYYSSGPSSGRTTMVIESDSEVSLNTSIKSDLIQSYLAEKEKDNRKLMNSLTKDHEYSAPPESKFASPTATTATVGAVSPESLVTSYTVASTESSSSSRGINRSKSAFIAPTSINVGAVTGVGADAYKPSSRRFSHHDSSSYVAPSPFAEKFILSPSSVGGVGMMAGSHDGDIPIETAKTRSTKEEMRIRDSIRKVNEDNRKIQWQKEQEEEREFQRKHNGAYR